MDIQSLAVGCLFGIVTGTVVTWLSNQSRLYRINAELKHDNTVLQTRVTSLEKKVADFEIQEVARAEAERNRKDHGRCVEQVSILSILHPNKKTSLKDIVHGSRLSEKELIYHLMCLSSDDCVFSDNYTHGGKHYTHETHLQSTWTIQREGLRYLHINGLLGNKCEPSIAPESPIGLVKDG